jgi:hypothetical protein
MSIAGVTAGGASAGDSRRVVGRDPQTDRIAEDHAVTGAVTENTPHLIQINRVSCMGS